MLLLFRRWGNIEFPMPFGRVMSPTETFIHGLDEKVNEYTVHLQIFMVNLILCTNILSIINNIIASSYHGAINFLL